MFQVACNGFDFLLSLIIYAIFLCLMSFLIDGLNHGLCLGFLEIVRINVVFHFSNFHYLVGHLHVLTFMFSKMEKIWIKINVYLDLEWVLYGGFDDLRRSRKGPRSCRN